MDNASRDGKRDYGVRIMSKCKRYLVFSGDTFYAIGGAKDYVGSFDSFSSAILAGGERLKDNDDDWFNILDNTTGIIKYSNGEELGGHLTPAENEKVVLDEYP